MVPFQGREQLTETIVDGRYMRPIIVKILTAAASFVLCFCRTVIQAKKCSQGDYCLQSNIPMTGSHLSIDPLLPLFARLFLSIALLHL